MNLNVFHYSFKRLTAKYNRSSSLLLVGDDHKQSKKLITVLKCLGERDNGQNRGQITKKTDWS